VANRNCRTRSRHRFGCVLMSFGILRGLERLLDAFGDGRSCENGALQRFS
jgi:hypothetical protein